MAVLRRLLRLELDLPRTGPDAEDGSGPAVLLWPKSESEPPDVPDAIIVSMDGDQVRLRAPGARLSEAASVGEWKFVRGARVRVSWGTNVQETQTFDLSDPAQTGAGVAHIELDLKGAPVRYLALPTTPGTRVSFGARSGNPDVPIDDFVSRNTICRITFDGKDYRLDSKDSTALALLNGAEIFWPATLHEGDQIYLGDASLRFSIAPPAGTLEPIAPVIPESAPLSTAAGRSGFKHAPARHEGSITARQLAAMASAAVFVVGFLAVVGWQLWGG